jgi:2-hydroxychromene-2-carboxylate isomerase
VARSHPHLRGARYTANFASDLDISQREVLRACLDGIVPDPDAVLASAGSDGVKDRLRQTTDRAIALGVFGAPTFVVGEEVFWGNDRLENALRWRVPALA